jgi:hypothetical protein
VIDTNLPRFGGAFSTDALTRLPNQPPASGDSAVRRFHPMLACHQKGECGHAVELCKIESTVDAYKASWEVIGRRHSMKTHRPFPEGLADWRMASIQNFQSTMTRIPFYPLERGDDIGAIALKHLKELVGALDEHARHARCPVPSFSNGQLFVEGFV